MLENIIILISVLFGIWQFIITKERAVRVILVIQVAAIIVLTQNMDEGNYLFLLSLLIVALHVSTNTELAKQKSQILVSAGIIAFGIVVHLLFPYLARHGLLMVVPILIYIIAIVSDWKGIKNEFGYLTFMNFYAVVMLMAALN
jgi:hypothetical protein